MNAVKLIAAAAIVTIAATGAAFAWGPHHGGGMMGGQGGCMMMRDKPLTATQAKDIVEGHIAMHGTDYVIGNVEDKGESLVVAVAQPDGKVVHHVQFDKKSGRFQPID